MPILMYSGLRITLKFLGNLKSTFKKTIKLDVYVISFW